MTLVQGAELWSVGQVFSHCGESRKINNQLQKWKMSGWSNIYWAPVLFGGSCYFQRNLIHTWRYTISKWWNKIWIQVWISFLCVALCFTVEWPNEIIGQKYNMTGAPDKDWPTLRGHLGGFYPGCDIWAGFLSSTRKSWKAEETHKKLNLLQAKGSVSKDWFMDL